VAVQDGPAPPDADSVLVDRSHAVPPEWLPVAAQLGQVATAVGAYLQLDPSPWPDSISSREKAREQEFDALPFEYPMAHVHLAPLQYLAVSQDHLTAIAAVVRTPGTVMALLTLQRTQLVATGWASYLADPSIDVRERVRRAMNGYLESTTEQMRLVGREDEVSARGFDQLNHRRQEVIRGAKQLGWHATTPQSPKRKAWPEVWWIGDKPPTEMAVLDSLLGDASLNDRIGYTLYRHLSGTSHARPHALLWFVDREQVLSRGDGSALAPIRMDGRMLATLAMTSVVALTIAMDRCVGLYGWPPHRWKQEVVPILNDLRSALGLPPPLR